MVLTSNMQTASHIWSTVKNCPGFQVLSSEKSRIKLLNKTRQKYNHLDKSGTFVLFSFIDTCQLLTAVYFSLHIFINCNMPLHAIFCHKSRTKSQQ